MNIKLWSFILATLFAVGLAAGNCAAEDGHRWAVVVGVNDYQKPSVTDLRYAESDAKLFSSALCEVGGFEPERVFLYTPDAERPDDRPRLTNLVYRMESLKEVVSENDSLFFYFAGHGVEIDGETFLLTENADNRSRATLTMSALRAELLLELLRDCNAKETLVVLDACRNDPMAGRGSEDNRMSDAMSRGLVFASKSNGATPKVQKSLATLLACGVGERSYEWPEKQHGYFTYHLVEGLKSRASDSAGQVSLAGLSRYVREKVSQDARLAGHVQQPSLKYEGPDPDRWVLSHSSESGDKFETLSELEKLKEEIRLLRAENDRLKAELEKLENR